MNFDSVYYFLLKAVQEIKMDYGISVGDIIACLSILFAIYQFRKQMFLSRKEQMENQKETWFLNVIVLPQLPEIKDFYKALLEKIRKQRRELRHFRGPNNKRLEKLAKSKSLDIEMVSNFFLYLETLVESYDSRIGAKLRNVDYGLQDVCSSLIDSYNEADTDTEVAVKILNSERIVISILNKGLKKI